MIPRTAPITAKAQLRATTNRGLADALVERVILAEVVVERQAPWHGGDGVRVRQPDG